MNSTTVQPLAPEQLRSICRLDADDLAPGDKDTGRVTRIAQQRAEDAIRMAMQIDQPGYNVFILGPTGTHRHGLAQRLATERAEEKGSPDDWCYINNFASPERPRALRLPAGMGVEFRDAMQALIEETRVTIPAAFEAEEYRNQLEALEEEAQKEVEAQWRSLREEAAREGIGVLQTSTGYVLAPRVDDEVIDDEQFKKLPEDQQKKIEAAIEHLTDQLRERIEEMPRLRKRHRERVRELNRHVTARAVSMTLGQLKQTYRELPEVLQYLEQVQEHIIDHAKDFRRSEEPALPFLTPDATNSFALYEVNLLVSNEPTASAPVVYEPNPSYPNLVGKIEHRAEMGNLVTDFRLIRSGALLAATGGYLILDIHRVLSRPFVWEALKQALLAKQVRIESPAESLGFASTTTLKPQPIPLDVKVLLIGERWLYYLLCMYDTEFRSLFGVAADLDDDLERTADNVRAYALVVAERIRDQDLLPFATDAVQAVIEQRARHADDSERLSMHMRSLDDLLLQADYWARQRDASEATADDVRKAIEQRHYHLNRVQTRIADAIRRDTLLIDTAGSQVGQVNGLSVIDLGDHRFGHPVRITATTRMGAGEVVDIEREVKLGGKIHSKGMLILSAALASRYARETPLSLHGSVVFEQSYGGVEGDSASVAELCALLSSISNVPIRQSVAVTGSINQLGRVQPVGGVNEKIEGFYDICRERGLDGSHAVVIPRDNVKHLMLREDVVSAVRERQFNVIAVRDIDEAITALTGEPAGRKDEDGHFPDGTVNRKVEDQLMRYAQRRKEFAEASDDGENKR